MFRCEECGRSFCVLDTAQMEEWYYGHDCEPQDDTNEGKNSLPTLDPVAPESSVNGPASTGEAPPVNLADSHNIRNNLRKGG